MKYYLKSHQIVINSNLILTNFCLYKVMFREVIQRQLRFYWNDILFTLVITCEPLFYWFFKKLTICSPHNTNEKRNENHSTLQLKRFNRTSGNLFLRYLEIPFIFEFYGRRNSERLGMEMKGNSRIITYFLNLTFVNSTGCNCTPNIKFSEIFSKIFLFK